jgi:3-hydroxybutyryl-CoA dehydratase
MGMMAESSLPSTGGSFSRHFRVTTAEMALFRQLSGDENPLHHDDEYARRRGFGGALVYGGILTAMVSGLLANTIPGAGCIWHSLAMQFRAPLYVDEAACLVASVLHLSEGVRAIKLKIEISTEDRVVATGEVDAVLDRAPG